MTNNKYRTVQIYKELHNKISVMASFNEVTMKIIARMFESHKEEIDEIIKEIKMMQN